MNFTKNVPLKYFPDNVRYDEERDEIWTGGLVLPYEVLKSKEYFKHGHPLPEDFKAWSFSSKFKFDD